MNDCICNEKKAPAGVSWLLPCIFCLVLGFLLGRLLPLETGPALETMARELKAGVPVEKTIETFLESVSHVFS